MSSCSTNSSGLEFLYFAYVFMVFLAKFLWTLQHFSLNEDKKVGCLWLQWKSIGTLLPPPQDTSDEGRGLTLLEKAKMSLGEGRGWGWPPSPPNCFRRKGLSGGGWRLNGLWDVHKRLGSELGAWSVCFHACDPCWTYPVRSQGSRQPQKVLRVGLGPVHS